MFGLVVRFTCKDQTSAEAFDRLTAASVEQIRQREPDTLLYVVHRVEGDPVLRIFYELYRDRAAFDAHEGQEHVRRFLAEREQYLLSTEVDFVTPQTSKGVSV
ncbi:MAG: antibiotic biosynthesis monooxygenase [Streptosporangiales bacterium]|nr:antibiotic biosynthesis monooxygenase [Streptosporangiales bacterium]